MLCPAESMRLYTDRVGSTVWISVAGSVVAACAATVAVRQPDPRTTATAATTNRLTTTLLRRRLKRAAPIHATGSRPVTVTATDDQRTAVKYPSAEQAGQLI